METQAVTNGASAPIWFWAVTAFIFGITIGSFLNVVIWRLPKGQTLAEPKHSYCPNCKNSLSAVDLVPLFSYLLLGRRCRQCHVPISSRYFWVELLTGTLFVGLTLHFFPNVPDCVTYLLFAAVMVPIFFIDLATFTIPISLNLLAFVIPVVRDLWGITQHEPNHALIGGWLPPSLLGALVGALFFGAVRVFGWLWRRVEAMGLGDVLLARGMGALLIGLVPAGANPLRLFPIWIIFSVSSGAIIGVASQLLRKPQAEEATAEENGPTTEADEIADSDESSLGRELMDIGYCLWLGDAWEYLRYYAAKWSGKLKDEPIIEEDDFVPAPSAIPFGPFMVLGFFATVFLGEWLTAAYLHWAIPPTLQP